jgi:HK97 family phage portal protein
MAIKDVIKLFSGGLFSSPSGNVIGGERFRVNQLIGQLQPFIGNDNKTQFIKDFERVKYAYAVISFIAQKAAKVPTVLFQLKAKGEKEQILENLLLGIINNRPNSYQTAYQFKYQFYGYYGATGEAYIYVPKLSSGRWQSMHIIPSDHIDPIYERRFEGPSGFLINDTGQVIPKEEMIYVRNEAFELVETGVGYKGLSPMKSLMTVLKKTADIDAADLASIQNGGVMGILADKTRQDEFGNTPWDEIQVGIVEKTMREKAYGPANKGKWLVTSGDVSWIPIGASPIDLNLFESDKKVLQDICIAFHVPYMIFRQEDSNQSFGTAMKEAKKAAYEDAILTWVESFHDSLNHFGIEGFGRNIVADYDTSGIAELQGDEKLKADKLAVEWWKTIAQKQRESGMEVDPSMEGKYLIPNNLVDPNDVDFGNEMAAFENNR